MNQTDHHDVHDARSKRHTPSHKKTSPWAELLSSKLCIVVGLMVLAVILLSIATILAYTGHFSLGNADSGTQKISNTGAPFAVQTEAPEETDGESNTTGPLSPEEIYQQNLATIQSDPPTVPEDRSTVYSTLLGRLKDTPELMEVIYHLEDYPLEMLTMLVNNGETLDTVLNYPAYQGTYDPELTAEEIEGFQAGEPVLLIQWDDRWAYYPMYTSLICWAGCGPTTLSMAYMTLTGDTTSTPDVMAEFAMDKGYYLEGQGSTWDLFNEGAVDLGLTSSTLSFSESAMKAALDRGSLIAVNFGPGDFTPTGHYSLIVGYDSDGFQVNDPNSRIRSAERWSFDELEGQIKNLWELSYQG